MRIPLTKYGMPQVAVFPAVLLLLMAVLWFFGLYRLPDWVVIVSELVFLVVLVWCLSFFRDPARHVPQDGMVLLAPADGKVTDITVLESFPGFDGPVQRIGIFLSIFDVHINRCPCMARVDKITYKPGQFRNAMSAESGRVNESNDLEMTRLIEPNDRIIVRQISGAIARRIVCAVAEGGELAGGEPFGMIKFGSRTELVVPYRPDVTCTIKVGEKVKAGLTIMVQYIKADSAGADS
ncbi:MAG: phosphatidylserine decarboxylase family protein [Sedimentisphaerales bacterium]|nr:phosphatidylserine decarboxylase family protein [Sedimentisphaerales bacterium]